MTGRVKIFLTGRIAVHGPAGTIDETDLAGYQTRTALAVLVHERRPVERDRLAHILWNGNLPEMWSTSLNAIVSKLRRQLGRTGLDPKETLAATGGSYVVSLPGDAWVDVEDAIRRADRADGASRHGDTEAAVSDATAASSILQRPFLPGVDGEWVDGVRRHLDAALFRCLVLLASGWNDRGDHQLASTIAERAIQLDPLRETAYRLLMEAELARGDSIAALLAYDRCERIVRDEFGASPSEVTTAVAERARQM